ncbi:hypothetical protein NC653_003141 [Populus alba x Populus x berolinensis]|uniref:Uncharacterized protein n=1 Tax=Populus alba x Populus x berolinensis TaxID=444605 RepID=A0AAD6RQT0_9ROSI|nr:hypothetical protein NC653_003141 [Populus alba x Populus x berolinensis]
MNDFDHQESERNKGPQGLRFLANFGKSSRIPLLASSSLLLEKCCFSLLCSLGPLSLVLIRYLPLIIP